jgi:hypothetical protein
VKAALVVLTLLWLPGCKKDIYNKEAVRQAMVDYLAKRTDLSPMDVRVDAVKFNGSQADAMVYLTAKSGPAAGSGMQMRYVLEKKDNRWEVKSRGASGSPHSGAGGMQMPMPMPNSGGALPPGHPQVPSQSTPEPPKK